VFVGNHSFESPDVPDAPPYAGSAIGVWQKTGLETQTGIFENTAAFGPPVAGADGQQLGFVFAAPGAGIFQDLLSPASAPLTYQVGQSYRLTVAVEGGGGGMPLNVPLDLRLYYVDPTITAGDNRVTVASTTYRNDNATGAITRLDDVSVDLPTVAGGQAWAGRQIGVRIVAVDDPTVTESGYFDIDNVRLTAVPEPAAGGLLLAAAGLGLLRRRRRATPQRGAGMTGREPSRSIRGRGRVERPRPRFFPARRPRFGSRVHAGRAAGRDRDRRRAARAAPAGPRQGAGVGPDGRVPDQPAVGRAGGPRVRERPPRVDPVRPQGPAVHVGRRLLPVDRRADQPAVAEGRAAGRARAAGPAVLGRAAGVLFCPAADQPESGDAELAKVGAEQAQCGYYYRHGSATHMFENPDAPIPPQAHIRLANLGRNRDGRPVRALAIDTQLVAPPGFAAFGVLPRTHHRERSANILFADGHAAYSPNTPLPGGGPGPTAARRYTIDMNDPAALRDAFDRILKVFERADAEE
jgi:prepilin-type processing-associated H-X9-DG protein